MDGVGGRYAASISARTVSSAAINHTSFTVQTVNAPCVGRFRLELHILYIFVLFLCRELQNERMTFTLPLLAFAK
jgi:hypothetical protein